MAAESVPAEVLACTYAESTRFMTCAESKSYLEEFIPLIKNIKDDRKVVIAPPFTAIATFSNHSNFDYLDIHQECKVVHRH